MLHIGISGPARIDDQAATRVVVWIWLPCGHVFSWNTDFARLQD